MFQKASLTLFEKLLSGDCLLFLELIWSIGFYQDPHKSALLTPTWPVPVFPINETFTRSGNYQLILENILLKSNERKAEKEISLLFPGYLYDILYSAVSSAYCGKIMSSVLSAVILFTGRPCCDHHPDLFGTVPLELPRRCTPLTCSNSFTM